jgi:flagellar basal-body rod protein FlgF
MENTLLIGLSRLTTLERQIDVISNNVANVNTNGFKADKAMFQEYLMPVAHADNFVGKDRRISYVMDRATWRDNGQGSIEQTGNPLDVALDGTGYLAVQTPAGERYTRNGSLQINSQGQLTTADGHLVLGTAGPITFQPGDHDVVISGTGTVSVRQGNTLVDSQRGQLRIVNFAQPQLLQKEGANLMVAPNGVAATNDPKTYLRQGSIERSNVSAVAEMSHLIQVSRTYQEIASILKQQGDMRKAALNQLSDVTS